MQKNKIDLTKTALKTTEAYNMLKKGDSVLIAVSGGADSVALLDFMLSISKEFSLKIGIAHLNHMLRGSESERDENFVKNAAKSLYLPFFSKKIDVYAYKKKKKLSLEEAAREIRYNFLEKTAENNAFNKIALGHNKDDNAELVLMNFLRGSGMTGLSGIPPVRDGKYIRPLINIEKKDILNYIKLKNLSFIQDSSNDDIKFLRNKVRHNLIPLLKNSYNPQIKTVLTNSASIIYKENKWLEQVANSFFDDVVLEKTENRLVFSINKIKYLKDGAKRRIIRRGIEYIKGNLRSISFLNIDSIEKLIIKKSPYASIDLSGNLVVQKEKDRLIFRKKEKISTTAIEYEYILKNFGTFFIKETGGYIKFSECSIDESPNFFENKVENAYFDKDKIKFPLIIRNFKNGDRFAPFGINGTQKVKKFFNAKKIPLNKRKTLPLVLSKGQIIWIAGYEISETVKIDSSTKKVIKAEMQSDKEIGFFTKPYQKES
jgi:tRNA(Ile)-lysidine synthase